jgi:hypothetical protein
MEQETLTPEVAQQILDDVKAVKDTFATLQTNLTSNLMQELVKSINDEIDEAASELEKECLLVIYKSKGAQ